ncbi:hypothetical protein XELAEV_18005370mg [Xenopus laevis]|uniref:Uncharacterized protein n=1 Tax=Xenopus laevis TaxID=8355 RepID=A0A974I366_XENLA|nr:hypothetical protein XELAEV_18005370mg [Xenopus laevis]
MLCVRVCVYVYVCVYIQKGFRVTTLPAWTEAQNTFYSDASVTRNVNNISQDGAPSCGKSWYCYLLNVWVLLSAGFVYIKGQVTVYTTECDYGVSVYGNN